MTRLLLVRHAQSHNNAIDESISRRHRADRPRAELEAALARTSDPELSEIGRAQAQQLAETLVPSLTDSFTEPLLISSPMRRALQTAMPLALGAKLDRQQFICHAELFEIGSGHYSDKTLPSTRIAQLEAEYPVSCQAIPSDELYVGRRRESADQARARVDRVIRWFDDLLAKEEHDLVVVVAHGNLLTQWLRRWIGVPWGRGLAFVHANAGLTLLHWDLHDGLLLEFANNLGHLESELRTGGRSSGWWDYTLPDLQIELHLSSSTLSPTLTTELAALRHHVLEPDGKTLADYAEIDQRSAHLVARVEGVLAGYAQYDPDLGRLRQLIVAPSHRRGRLGRLLVLKAELEAQLDGRDQLLVHAWVESIEFYRALGFVEHGPIEHGPGKPWQAMIKTLPFANLG